MEALESFAKINKNMDKIETEVLADSESTPKENIVLCSDSGDVELNIKEPEVNGSTEHNKCETDGANEKENDGWEVVDASSDESEESSDGNFDIIIPLKVIENTQSNVSSILPVVPGVTTDKDIEVDTNGNGTAVGPHPKKNIHQLENEAVVNKKQNTQTQPPKTKVKKRMIRLFTGDSSDEEVVSKSSGNIKNVNERENKMNENKQKALHAHNNIQSEISSLEINESAPRHNATFTKDNPTKFHSDTEITVCDDLKHKKKIYPSGSKSSKLCDITEMESDEDIIEVPRSPCADNSTYHMIPSRKKAHGRDTNSHNHDSNCNSRSLLSSPNSRRAKRQKLMQQMWQERERKLKLKMVKKMKTVFYHVLESIVSSSDESADCSLSDEEEDIHASQMLKKRKQPCNKQCCSKNNETESIRDLKRELQYWKNKAKTGTEVLSPRELQIREMKEDLNYWKRLATHAPSSSHSYAIPRTSTPEKEEDRVPEMPIPRPHEISRVTSSADITSHIPPLSSEPRTAATNEGVCFSTQDKQKSNPFSRETYKPSVSTEASRALNVMSRTKFTEKEKDQIVEYLVIHYDRLELLKGNMFWMQMAHDLDTHRSWHSLKNNFFTNIIKNLEQYKMPTKVRHKIMALAKQYM